MRAIYHLSPEQEAALDQDIQLRLDAEGYPIHPGNDYELHLCARKLRNGGMSREEVRATLLPMVITKIPFAKAEQYTSDIVDSILVGFGDLPVYGKEELS